MKTLLARLLPLLCLATLVPALAQGPARGGQQVSVRYAHSAENDLTAGGVAAGALTVDAFNLTWRGAAPIGPATQLTYGLTWQEFSFDRPATSAVPDRLRETSLAIGAAHRLNKEWLLLGSLSPGLYGDGDDTGSDAFNAPLLLLATWRRNADLAWSFGLRADRFSDRTVLPFVGVNWKFAPGWEFNLGMPRAGFIWTPAPDLQLGLGVSLQGGDFHVARDPRPVSMAVGSRLDDTRVDYHEIRVGLAADWRLNPALALTVEAGLITDQKLDYFQRDYAIDGGRAGYFALGLSGRF